MSTPVLSSNSDTSASRKPSLPKRRPMPISESGRSPQTKSFPTINEPLSKPDVEKPIPPEPKLEYKAQSKNDVGATRHHKVSRSFDVLAYQPPPRDSLTPPSQPISEKPTYIELPRPNHLPSELHVHTPEYTNALKQWFPAVATAAQKNSYRDKNEKSVQAC
jgi:hypothetical protein